MRGSTRSPNASLSHGIAHTGSMLLDGECRLPGIAALCTLTRSMPLPEVVRDHYHFSACRKGKSVVTATPVSDNNGAKVEKLVVTWPGKEGAMGADPRPRTYYLKTFTGQPLQVRCTAVPCPCSKAGSKPTQCRPIVATVDW